MRSSWFRRRKAFSLIELVVSVLVIVVLAAAGTVAFNQFVGKSSKTSATASASALRDALQARATTEDVPVAELAETLWAAPSPLSELGVVFDGTVEYQPADGAETALLKVNGPGEKHSTCIDLPKSARTVPPVYPCTPGEHSGNTEEDNDDGGDFNSGAGQLEAPAAPTDVAAAWLAGNTAITVTWSHDRVDVDSFTVQRQHTDDTWLNLAAGLAPSATSFTDTDVSADTGSTYRVAAVNAAGETFTGPFTVPSATSLRPTGVTAERVDDTVNIAWTYTGPTSGVTFTVERQEDTGGTWVEIGTQTVTGRSFIDADNVSNVDYSYRVAATTPFGIFVSPVVLVEGVLQWVALRGNWVGNEKAASTTTPTAQNPLYVTDLNTPNVDVSVSMFNGDDGADALYFRVQDADNWWRVRQNTTRTTTTVYGPWTAGPWNTVRQVLVYYQCIPKETDVVNGFTTKKTLCIFAGRQTDSQGNPYNLYQQREQTRQVTRTATPVTSVTRSLVLERATASTVTTAETWELAATDQVRVSAAGDTISVYSPNSALLGTVDDATFNDATMFGVGLGGTGAGSNLRNFIASAIE